MTTALNMTLPLKQDEQSQQALKELKDRFATHVQPAIDAALRKSGTVHFARVLVIEDKYIQVLTEFDGSNEDYTEFFRLELQGVFKAIFSLVEGAPQWEEMNNRDAFFKASRKYQVRALGASTRGEMEEGYLFSAFGETTVREISEALQSRGASAARSESGFSSGWPVPDRPEYAAAMHHPGAMAMHHPGAMAMHHPGAMAMHHPGAAARGAVAMHHPGAVAMHHPGAVARGAVAMHHPGTIAARGEHGLGWPPNYPYDPYPYPRYDPYYYG